SRKSASYARSRVTSIRAGAHAVRTDMMGRMNAPVRFRWAWWLLAYLSLGLGILGVILPGLPTVPFILLAAWAAMRGSPRLHAWLLAHPHCGPMIHNWQEHGAITRRSKVLAIGTMVLCAVIVFVFAPRAWIDRK